MAKGEPSNVERAGRAAKVLGFYQDKVMKEEPDDIATSLSDTIADMMHLARFENIDWEDIMRRANNHFTAEVSEEGEDPRAWSPRGWRGWK